MSDMLWNHVKHLLKYKDLFLVFIWREFSIRYRQSLIGFLWAIIQPLSLMLLFTLVFTYLMPVKVSDYPYSVFFYSALLPWSFFSSSLNYAVPSLTGHYNLITKIYFPREIIPLSGIAVAFIDFVIASLVFIGLLLFYKIPLTVQALWVLPLFFLLIIFTVSISLILSALNVYYRDVNLAINFLIQLWFFATPIFYSINNIPAKLKTILFLNPLAYIIENMRKCVIEGSAIILWQYFSMLIYVIVIFFISYNLFKKTEIKFADVI